MRADKGTVTKALQRAGFDVRPFRYEELRGVNVTKRLRGYVRVFLNRDLAASVNQLAEPDANGFSWELKPEFLALTRQTAQRVADALNAAGFHAEVCVFLHSPASGGESFVEVTDS